MTAKWWVVMLPGEYVETSEAYGPYASERRANEVRDAWNRNHPDDKAIVLPVRPKEAMR